MRARLHRVLALAVLLFPSEASLSGSSTVAATSKYFRVEIESMRPHFRDPDQEGEWHRRWKAEHQAEVERIKRVVEEQLPRALKENKLTLLDYREDYAEILDVLADEEDAKPILKSGKPFRYRYQLRGIDVVFVFAKLPPPAARAAFKTALERIVRPDP